MTDQDIIDEFKQAGAFLEGHFILTSGRHSSVYMQCARALMDPKRAQRLVFELKQPLNGLDVNIVLAPAIGGIVIGYEIARQLGCVSMFVERVSDRFALRRGFSIGATDRILIAEDVITTGMSTRECINLCRMETANVAAVVCLIDRSNGQHGIDVPVFSLLEIDMPTHAPDQLPSELSAIAPTKPGSRQVTLR